MNGDTTAVMQIDDTTATNANAIGQSVADKFAEFHAKNPHVYQCLVAKAVALAQRGHRRISIKMLFETLRFEHAMQTDDPNSEFKLNNDYTAFYARLLDDLPQLHGRFELRTQRYRTHIPAHGKA